MKRVSLSPFITLCLILHIAGLILLLAKIALWPWLLTGFILLHVLIAIAGLLPRSRLLGDNLTHLPAPACQRREIAITIDDGPDPVITPQVLAILAKHQAKATFFCIGERARLHPDICRQAIAEGHAVENHGQYHHTYTAFSGMRGWKNEVVGGQQTLYAITGQLPRFYRPIAGLRNPFLDPVLQQANIRLTSWTRRGYDTRESNPDIVLQRLLRNLKAGDVLLLHDGNAARQEGEPVILQVLPRLLDELTKRELHSVNLWDACTKQKTS